MTLTQAIDAERLERIGAYAPLGGVVGRYRLPHFTLAHWGLLPGSPFLVGGSVSAGDVMAALWVLTAEDALSTVARGLFVGSFAGVSEAEFEELAEGLGAYFDSVFFDVKHDPLAAKIYRPPNMTAPDWLLYQFVAPPFSWLVEKVMKAPVKMLYQIRKCHLIANGLTPYNPLSDPIRRNELREFNNRNK
jgi:hypothetical protein